MLPDRMEDVLDSVSTKQLSEEARRDLRIAVIAADVAGRRPWWKRSVPLWQMAAACVVAAVLSFWAARGDSPDDVSVPSVHPRFVAQNASPRPSRATSGGPAVVQFKHRPAYRPDITRWRRVAVNVEGV